MLRKSLVKPLVTDDQVDILGHPLADSAVQPKNYQFVRLLPEAKTGEFFLSYQENTQYQRYIYQFQDEKIAEAFYETPNYLKINGKSKNFEIDISTKIKLQILEIENLSGGIHLIQTSDPEPTHIKSTNIKPVDTKVEPTNVKPKEFKKASINQLDVKAHRINMDGEIGITGNVKLHFTEKFELKGKTKIEGVLTLSTPKELSEETKKKASTKEGHKEVGVKIFGELETNEFNLYLSTDVTTYVGSKVTVHGLTYGEFIRFTGKGEFDTDRGDFKLDGIFLIGSINFWTIRDFFSAKKLPSFKCKNNFTLVTPAFINLGQHISDTRNISALLAVNPGINIVNQAEDKISVNVSLGLIFPNLPATYRKLCNKTIRETISDFCASTLSVSNLFRFVTSFVPVLRSAFYLYQIARDGKSIAESIYALAKTDKSKIHLRDLIPPVVNATNFGRGIFLHSDEFKRLNLSVLSEAQTALTGVVTKLGSEEGREQMWKDIKNTADVKAAVYLLPLPHIAEKNLISIKGPGVTITGDIDSEALFSANVGNVSIARQTNNVAHQIFDAGYHLEIKTTLTGNEITTAGIFKSSELDIKAKESLTQSPKSTVEGKVTIETKVLYQEGEMKLAEGSEVNAKQFVQPPGGAKFEIEKGSVNTEITEAHATFTANQSSVTATNSMHFTPESKLNTTDSSFQSGKETQVSGQVAVHGSENIFKSEKEVAVSHSATVSGEGHLSLEAPKVNPDGKITNRSLSLCVEKLGTDINNLLHSANVRPTESFEIDTNENINLKGLNDDRKISLKGNSVTVSQPAKAKDLTLTAKQGSVNLNADVNVQKLKIISAKDYNVNGIKVNAEKIEAYVKGDINQNGNIKYTPIPNPRTEQLLSQLMPEYKITGYDVHFNAQGIPDGLVAHLVHPKGKGKFKNIDIVVKGDAMQTFNPSSTVGVDVNLECANFNSQGSTVIGTNKLRIQTLKNFNPHDAKIFKFTSFNTTATFLPSLVGGGPGGVEVIAGGVADIRASNVVAQGPVKIEAQRILSRPDTHFYKADQTSSSGLLGNSRTVTVYDTEVAGSNILSTNDKVILISHGTITAIATNIAGAKGNSITAEGKIQILPATTNHITITEKEGIFGLNSSRIKEMDEQIHASILMDNKESYLRSETSDVNGTAVISVGGPLTVEAPHGSIHFNAATPNHTRELDSRGIVLNIPILSLANNGNLAATLNPFQNIQGDNPMSANMISGANTLASTFHFINNLNSNTPFIKTAAGFVTGSVGYSQQNMSMQFQTLFPSIFNRTGPVTFKAKYSVGLNGDVFNIDGNFIIEGNKLVMSGTPLNSSFHFEDRSISVSVSAGVLTGNVVSNVQVSASQNNASGEYVNIAPSIVNAHSFILNVNEFDIGSADINVDHMSGHIGSMNFMPQADSASESSHSLSASSTGSVSVNNTHSQEVKVNQGARLHVRDGIGTDLIVQQIHYFNPQEIHEHSSTGLSVDLQNLNPNNYVRPMPEKKPAPENKPSHEKTTPPTQIGAKPRNNHAPKSNKPENNYVSTPANVKRYSGVLWQPKPISNTSSAPSTQPESSHSSHMNLSEPFTKGLSQALEDIAHNLRLTHPGTSHALAKLSVFAEDGCLVIEMAKTANNMYQAPEEKRAEILAQKYMTLFGGAGGSSIGAKLGADILRKFAQASVFLPLPAKIVVRGITTVGGMLIGSMIGEKAEEYNLNRR